MGDIKLAADAQKILMRKHTEQIEKRNVILRSDVHCTSAFFFILLVFTKMKNELFFFLQHYVSSHFSSLWPIEKSLFKCLKRNDLKFLSVCRKTFDTFIENGSFVFMSFSTLKWHCSLLYVIDISSQSFWNWWFSSFRRSIVAFHHFFIKLSSHYEL